MRFPRQIYLILIYDNTGKDFESVYVGSTHNVKERIGNHLHCYSKHQEQLHNLMRSRKFDVKVVGDAFGFEDDHLEYDWVNYFQTQTNLNVMNIKTDLLGADWHRITEVDKWKKSKSTTS